MVIQCRLSSRISLTLYSLRYGPSTVPHLESLPLLDFHSLTLSPLAFLFRSKLNQLLWALHGDIWMQIHVCGAFHLQSSGGGGVERSVGGSGESRFLRVIM